MGQRSIGASGQSKYYAVDPSKLKRAIHEHGIGGLSEFCNKAGHSPSWVSKRLKNGVINEPMLVWLKFFGIEYDEIKPEPIKEEHQEVKPMTVRDLTKEDLKEMIYSAMLAALNAEGV